MNIIMYLLLIFFVGVIISFGSLTLVNDLKLLNRVNLNRFIYFTIFLTFFLTIVLFYTQDVILLDDTSKVTLTTSDATVTIKAPVSLFTEIGKPAVFASGLQVGYRLFKNSPIPVYGKGLLAISFGSISYLSFHTVHTITEGRKTAIVEFVNPNLSGKTLAENAINKLKTPDVSNHTSLQEVIVSNADLNKFKNKVDNNTTRPEADMDIPDITFCLKATIVSL
jgi:hypothetical protein